METLHSKSPWHACNDGGCQCGLVWGGTKENQIVVAAALNESNRDFTGGTGVMCNSDEFYANMRLVAAAPELLESVQNLVGMFDNPAGKRRQNSMQKEALELARKAINKAVTGKYEIK